MREKNAFQRRVDAGNPRVWFDEGEVASAATPKRGSLLHKNKPQQMWQMARGMLLSLMGIVPLCIDAVTISSDYSITGDWVHYLNQPSTTLPATGITIQGKYVDERTTYQINVPSGHKATISITYTRKGSSEQRGYLVVRNTATDWEGQYNVGDTYSKTFTSSVTLELRAYSTGTYYGGNISELWCYYDTTVKYESLSPDLTITSFSASKDEVSSDETVTLSYAIKNVGGVQASPSTAYVYDNGTRVGTIEIEALSSGASESGSFALPKLACGNHSVKIVADAVNDIVELNEVNNEASAALTVYERGAQYAVRFDANGGTGYMVNQSFVYGTAQNLHANAYSNPEMVFCGWATNINGSVVYRDEQSVKNLSYVSGAVLTLYAVWERRFTIVDGVLTKVTLDSAECTIPSSVTSIGDYAFKNCSGMRSATIPNSVTSIGDFAFEGCSGLTSVTMPDSVTSIGEWAFSSCDGLTSVTLGDGMTSIGSYAFDGCSGLKNIVFRGNAPNVGESTFNGVGEGCAVRVHRGSTGWGVEIPGMWNGMRIEYLDDEPPSFWSGTETIDGITWQFTVSNGVAEVTSRSARTSAIPSSTAGDITVPSVLGGYSVTSIGNYAFYYCRSLTSVTIPDSVTSIGDYTFKGCSGLTSVTIPPSVKMIGRDAFLGCKRLASVHIADLIAWCGISFGYGGSFEQYNLYLGGAVVTNLVIPATITQIRDYAFSGCSSLTSVTIPNSITAIGYEAFAGCAGLQEMTLPFIGKSRTLVNSSYQDLLGYLFNNTEFEGGVRVTQHFATSGGFKSTSFCFPAALRSVRVTDAGRIGYGAFNGCHMLTNIVISSTVTNIGFQAFGGCSGLQRLEVPFVGSVRDDISGIAHMFGLGFRRNGLCVFPGSNAMGVNYSLPVGPFKLVVTDEDEISPYCLEYRASNDRSNIGFPLTDIELGNKLKSIERNVFSNCKDLERVVIGSGVTNVAGGAFSDCKRLTSILVDDGNDKYLSSSDGLLLEKDGKTLICVLPGLTSVTIPGSVTTIGNYAFVGCSGLTSVTIPDSVTNIGDYAFEDCSGLASVRIPNSVMSIGEGVFYGCSGLASVTIPNPVANIGRRAFYGCSGLKSVTIPDSVTSIEDSAFYGCSGLKSVMIPDSVTSIGYGVFEGCSGLKDVTVPQYVLDRKICNIFSSAYSSLTNVSCSSVVTNIGSSAFYGCSGLTSVTIGSGVTSIGADAFDGCGGLASIAVAIGNANYSSVNGLLLSKDGKTLIQGVNGDVTIPDGVTTIGDVAFHYCKGLTSVTIPDSVTNIGSYAFDGCRGLTSVTIPDGVTSIGKEAFYGCTGLTSLTIGNGVTSIEFSAFERCTGLTSLTIGNSVTNIGEWAFSNCKGLTSVTIPDSVTSIGGSAFSGCNNVHDATVPGWQCRIPFGNVTNLVISEGTTNIGERAFSGCSGLTSVTIPDSVTSIGNYAFGYCSGLTSVTIGNSVTSIGQYAFQYCRGLTSVTIPDSVTNIGSYAFDGCRGLTSVTIGSGVTSIGAHAFDGCGGLASIAVAIGNANYSSVNGLLLSKDGKTLIQGVNGDVTIPDGVTSIGGSAFYDCRGLTSVTIPDSVTSIGGFAFFGCSGLTSVTIPDGVTSIGNSAFYNCSGLTSVTIPDSMTSIGYYAFGYCSGLTSVTIPNSVTSIGAWAFSYCSALTSVTIPARFKDNLDSSVLQGCPSSLKITYYDSSAYTVRYRKYDGSGETASEDLECGRTYNLSWLGSELGWSRPNYEFVGWVPWNPDTKPRLCKYVNGQPVKDLAKAGEIIDLWAGWKSSSSYRVCFHRCAGPDDLAKMNQVILRNKEDNLAWMDSMIGWKREGYTFLGWDESDKATTVKYANGAKVKNLAMNGGTKHLYAVWRAKDDHKYPYTVKYYKYDGSGTTRTQSFKAGTVQSLLWMDSQLGWSRPGYEFVGWVPWNPDTKPRLCKYVNGQKVVDLASKSGEVVNLYPAWKSSSSYRVCFNRNDGTGVKMNQVILRNKEDNLAWMDSQIGWKRDGYVFKGWAESEKGAVKYANGAKVKNLAMNGGTKHLYAIWRLAD